MNVSTTRRSAAVVLVVAVVLIVGIVSFSRYGSSDHIEQAAAGDPAGRTSNDNSQDAPELVPDPLDDPDVGPGECAMVTYTPDSAEDAFEGRLCRPESDQRDVAVVVVHGGSGITGSHHSVLGWEQRLLAEGYVTMLPGYHLFVPGSNERPVFPRPEQNIKAAVQYVRGTANALGIRRDRIALQGHSAGARLGAVAYTTPDDDWFDGDELYASISDAPDAFIGFYHPYDGSMQYSQQYYGGSADGDDDARERWEHADALANAADAAGPALFITGSNDWSLIDEHQDEFVALLRAPDISARARIIEGGGHGFDLGAQRLTRLGEEAATHVLRFLNEVFPQQPARPAQSSPVDLDSAPSGTGAAPTTVDTRPRRTTSSTTTPAQWGSSTTQQWQGQPSTSSSFDDSPSTTDGSASSSSTTVETQPPTTNEPSPTTAPPTVAPTPEPTEPVVQDGT